MADTQASAAPRLITVVNPESQPIDGAYVRSDAAVSTTDARGCTRVPLESTRLVVAHPDYVPAQVDVGPARGGANDDLIVVLQRGAVVRGQCIDEHDLGVADVTVAVTRGDAAAGATPPIGGVAPDSVAMVDGSITYDRSASSDSDGRFEVRGLLPGAHTLHVDRLGYVLAGGAMASRFFTDDGDQLVALRRVYVLCLRIASQCPQHHAHSIRETSFTLPHPRGLHVAPFSQPDINRQLNRRGLRFGDEVRDQYVQAYVADDHGLEVGNRMRCELTCSTVVDAPQRQRVEIVALDIFDDSMVSPIAAFSGCRGYGRARVKCNTPIAAWREPGTNATYILSGEMESGSDERVFDLPVGSYTLRPTNMATTSAARRQISIEIRDGSNLTVDGSVFDEGLGFIDIAVTDAAGRPTNRYYLLVTASRGGRFTTAGETRGASWRLPAEPGKYTVDLMDCSGTRRVSQADVTVSAGQTSALVMKLSE